MKLSHAIRLGATMKPQGFGTIYRDGKTCALGAAIDAIGLLYDSGWKVAAHQQGWTEICSYGAYGVQCPVCIDYTSNIEAIIVHLNDTHRWIREHIADWVETQELEFEISRAPAELPDPIPTPEEAPVEAAS